MPKRENIEDDKSTEPHGGQKHKNSANDAYCTITTKIHNCL